MLQHLILSIEEVESVRLSQKRIPSLKTLEIRNSPTLRVVAGLKNLTSLNSLIIEACPNLEFKGLPATLEQVKLSRSSLFEKGYKEQQHMPNDLMIEAHNSDDEDEEEEEEEEEKQEEEQEEMDVNDEEEEEEQEEMYVNDEEEEEMDGEDDDNNDNGSNIEEG
ncbi:acidic leucine-rich nuclear phosphoprotein 32 family member A-like [Zingiber officinale]|uniref:acidic leucine-rich nuclear phosphoprotein 32 family member A-like n=1 Tax=Zingiber officinale TaxID=94328 RepID=UPI001C4AC98E|nr:acidic leucine-rich nuclear phosphoprotein 32 family member A-like [Zingiber officinale]